MKLLGVSRVKEDEDWRLVPEVLYYVAPEEYTIVEKIRKELADPEYRGRLHGERGLYQSGCRGPLCGKAARDYMRDYMRRRQKYVLERRTRTQRFDYITALMNMSYRKRLAERVLANTANQ